MKLHLPLGLLAALLLAAVTPAQAGASFDEFDIINVPSGENVAISSDTSRTEHYHAIVKDGAGSASITGNVTKYSGIIVREGELLIGDGTTTTSLRIEITDDNDDIYGLGIGVGGKDAVVTFNKASYSNGGEIFNQVGGSNGNGTINITNGSVINLTSNSNFLVGNNTYCTEVPTEPNSGDTYQGNYTTGLNGIKFGKGIINVTGGSTLNTGYHNFWMSEGEINVSGAGAVVNICNYYGNRTILGLEAGSTSALNVTEGGTLILNSDSLTTGWYSKSITNINIDGEGSKLIRPNERPPHPDNGIKGKTKTEIAKTGGGCITNISVTNGGAAEFMSDTTYFGSTNSTPDSWAKVTVDDKSSFSAKTVELRSESSITTAGTVTMEALTLYGDVTNSGTFNAATFTAQDGSTLEITGAQAVIESDAFDAYAGSTIKLTADEREQAPITISEEGYWYLDDDVSFILIFSEEYMESLETATNTVSVLVANTAADYNGATVSVENMTQWNGAFTWVEKDGKTYIEGSLNAISDITVSEGSNLTDDIGDVNEQEQRSITITGDATLSGDNSHTGGTTIAKDAVVTLGSDTALGNGEVSIGENVTASITTADDVEKATLPTTIKNKGSLTLDGSFDASDLDAPVVGAEGDTYVCINGEEGNNGFFRDGDSVIDVVENSDSATLKVVNGTTITYGNDTLHLATSGKAGKLTLDTYHIVDEDHVGIMSEIQKMSGGKTKTIDMRGGTLIVNEDATDVQASAGTLITDGDVKLGGELSGQATVIVDDGTAELSGDNSYEGPTIIEGSESTLVVKESTALGKSTVYLQKHGTLDLNSQAVGNDIYVEGCTICNAANYNGNVTVTGDLELVDTTNNHIARANKVTFEEAGNIKSSNATLIVNSVEMASDATGEINSDLTTNEGGTIILNNGSQLKVNGALTLGKGTTFVLKGNGYAAGSELGYGDPTADSITTGSATLTNGRGTYAIEDGVIYLTAVFDNSIAEALTVTNWGIATASRTFVNAVRGQRTNTGCIADGRGTAWAAVLGGTSDIGSGDVDLKGAAVGADMKVGEKSSLGVAFGYIDGDAKIPGMSKAEQEGTYVALYGEHGLKKLSATSCLSLDWVAAYGQTDTEWESADWEQDSLQLNTRLNWNKKVTDRLCMSVFGGLEYFTSESDRVENAKTGSIQNLRGEIGVGARYVAWGTPGSEAVTDEKGATIAAARPGCEKLVLHGEIRYMNDMVRSNPVIEQDGIRDGGSDNPGRQGMGLEAGATYRISERWSASANYGFNTMEDSKEHRVNVGASYTF